MVFEVLLEDLDLLAPEHELHNLVGGEPLLIGGVLKRIDRWIDTGVLRILLFQECPESLDDLGPEKNLKIFFVYSLYMLHFALFIQYSLFLFLKLINSATTVF